MGTIYSYFFEKEEEEEEEEECYGNEGEIEIDENFNYELYDDYQNEYNVWSIMCGDK